MDAGGVRRPAGLAVGTCAASRPAPGIMSAIAIMQHRTAPTLSAPTRDCSAVCMVSPPLGPTADFRRLQSTRPPRKVPGQGRRRGIMIKRLRFYCIPGRLPPRPCVAVQLEAPASVARYRWVRSRMTGGTPPNRPANVTDRVTRLPPEDGSIRWRAISPSWVILPETIARRTHSEGFPARGVFGLLDRERAGPRANRVAMTGITAAFRVPG